MGYLCVFTEEGTPSCWVTFPVLRPPCPSEVKIGIGLDRHTETRSKDWRGSDRFKLSHTFSGHTTHGVKGGRRRETGREPVGVRSPDDPFYLCTFLYLFVLHVGPKLSLSVWRRSCPQGPLTQFWSYAPSVPKTKSSKLYPDSYR